jgi:hypothetical protein
MVPLGYGLSIVACNIKMAKQQWKVKQQQKVEKSKL